MKNFFKNLMNELDNFDMATTYRKQVALEKEFLAEVRKRKEFNSEQIWSCYYIPLAAKQIIKEQGTLTKADEYRLNCLANSMMFKDMADGVITELYRFAESEG